MRLKNECSRWSKREIGHKLEERREGKGGKNRRVMLGSSLDLYCACSSWYESVVVALIPLPSLPS